MSIIRVVLGAQCGACSGRHGGRRMESQSPAAHTVRSALSSCLYSWGHKNSWVAFLAGVSTACGGCRGCSAPRRGMASSYSIQAAWGIPAPSGVGLQRMATSMVTAE